MITIKEVKTQMAETIESIAQEAKKSKISRLKKQYQFLVLIHNYLRTIPEIDYIRSILNKKIKDIEIIADRYKEWTPPNGLDFAQARRFYDKEMGVPHIKNQIKALKYILKK